MTTHTDEIRLTRTPLYALHLEHGTKIVPFAGYLVPVQYPTGIKAEHELARDKTGREGTCMGRNIRA